MIEFRVLGASEVRCSGGATPKRIELPPKRLSLLSYLTLAKPRGPQRRDIVCTLFWPESDHANARNALNQALHGMRRSLGESIVVSGGREEVDLARDSLECDGVVFESHLNAGRLREALELYRGDLLPGVYARGAAGFEHWLDAERVRLRRQARDAASRLARAEEERDDPAEAVRWLVRGLEIVPTDEALVRRLITELDRDGNRTGALAAYERFATLLHSEYETTPAPETATLIEGVRARTRPRPHRTPAAAADARVRSIAVLPLHDAGADERRSYSVDGMTEGLVTELGRIRSLRVISYQSVRRFKGSHLPLREIARALEVDALVEGSVLEAGGRVRVTAQLVRAESEQHLWVDAFEAEARDVISMHRDMARSIGAAVAAAVSAEEERLLTSPQEINPAAYHAYLQGWIRQATLLPTGLAAAVPLYLEAIRLDPEFAPPRANLCITQFALLSMGELQLDPTLAAMRDGADLALRLDPALAETHTAQGVVRIVMHDWSGAEECLHHATRLAPNQSQAYTALAVMLVGLGRSDEALQAAEQARRLDPLAPFANWILGCCLHYARRPAEAIHQLHRVLELFADYPLAWVFLAKCHSELGERNAAIEACQRSVEMLAENPMTLAYVTHVLARLGEQDAANRVMERLERERAKRAFAAPFYTASALSGLGRIEEALDAADQIRSHASTTGYLLSVDPLLDPLRSEPRFRNLLQRLGLPILPAL